jgi:hypothetical protein
MKAYGYVTESAIVEFFAACRKRERGELLRIFTCLADDPFQRSDYVQRLPGERELQVKRFGKWLVSYWPDHPVAEVRIVDVERIVG